VRVGFLQRAWWETWQGQSRCHYARSGDRWGHASVVAPLAGAQAPQPPIVGRTIKHQLAVLWLASYNKIVSNQ